MIITLITDITNALSTSDKTFGHGPKSYQNLESFSGLLVWLLPFVNRPIIDQQGALIDRYNIVIVFGKQVTMDKTAEDLRQELEDIEPYVREFILRLDKDSRVEKLDVQQYDPHYNELSQNMVGFALAMSVQLLKRNTLCTA